MSGFDLTGFDRAELRDNFLEALPPSFPAEAADFRINQGPVRWNWSRNHQGFSKDWENFLIKDNRQEWFRNHYTEQGTYANYDRAVEDLDQAIATANRLDWIKEPGGRAWCHRELEGTICAVHRWNARFSNEIVGRLQCWNDPGLEVTDSSFLQEHTEFQDAEGDGSVCVLELQDSIVGIGFPAGCAWIATNHIEIDENWDVGWEIEIEEADTVASTLHKMRGMIAELRTSKQPAGDEL
jgi:hypothetical protein